MSLPRLLILPCLEPKVNPLPPHTSALLNTHSHACTRRQNRYASPSPSHAPKKLHNQLMELQNPAWRGLTNSSRLQAPATLTSVAPDCGEAGRTGGACLLASAGREASRLQHRTKYRGTCTRTHFILVAAEGAHMHAELGAATSDPVYGRNHKAAKGREQNVVNWHEWADACLTFVWNPEPWRSCQDRQSVINQWCKRGWASAWDFFCCCCLISVCDLLMSWCVFVAIHDSPSPLSCHLHCRSHTTCHKCKGDWQVTCCLVL